MPSLTKCFSYTVLESLQAGIPVLISDQTPWRDLEAQGIGWDLELSDSGRWLQALENLALYDVAQSQIRRQQAADFASELCSDYCRRAEGLFRSVI